jgi:hypothetical protein
MKKALLGLLLCWITTGQLTAQINYLHTPGELIVWRQRAAAGPYKSKGDAQANSPDDWLRIARNANAFLTNTSAELWDGYTGTGCIQQNTATSTANMPLTYGVKLQDAALYYLVTGSTTHGNAVKSVLLQQILKPGTNFADSTKWCPPAHGLHDVSPGFIIAEWVHRELNAYMATYALYSPGERTQILAFFTRAGSYFQTNVDTDISGMFVNRAGGNYTLTGLGVDPSPRELTYYGGPYARRANLQHINRRATMIEVVALIGVLTNNASFKNSGILFTKEYLQYGVYPDGNFAELSRFGVGKPEKGISYAVGTVNTLCRIADALARTGDFSLYAYATTVGAFGTQGAPTGAGNEQFASGKSLKFCLYALARYFNGTYQRWGTEEPSLSTDPEYIMDGVFNPQHVVYEEDIYFALPNLYYKDSFIRNAYLRLYPNARPYSAKPTNSGAYPIWSGATHSGFLFMHSNLESSPYNPFYTDPADTSGIPTRINVALGKSVSVSSHYLGFRGAAVTDGQKDNYALRYVSAPNAVNDTVIIDLVDTCSIDTLKLYLGKKTTLNPTVANPPQSFVIAAYSAGTWTDLYATTSNTSNTVILPVSVPMATRLRFIGRDVAGLPWKNHTRLIEMEAWGLKQ